MLADGLDRLEREPLGLVEPARARSGPRRARAGSRTAFRGPRAASAAGSPRGAGAPRRRRRRAARRAHASELSVRPSIHASPTSANSDARLLEVGSPRCGLARARAGACRASAAPGPARRCCRSPPRTRGAARSSAPPRRGGAAAGRCSKLSSACASRSFRSSRCASVERLLSAMRSCVSQSPTHHADRAAHLSAPKRPSGGEHVERLRRRARSPSAGRPRGAARPPPARSAPSPRSSSRRPRGAPSSTALHLDAIPPAGRSSARPLARRGSGARASARARRSGAATSARSGWPRAPSARRPASSSAAAASRASSAAGAPSSSA